MAAGSRRHVLQAIKRTVGGFECELTREIVALIKRETDLLGRGRGEASLGGLRSRLANLFLEFVQTPRFNPEEARVHHEKRQKAQMRRAPRPANMGKLIDGVHAVPMADKLVDGVRAVPVPVAGKRQE